MCICEYQTLNLNNFPIFIYALCCRLHVANVCLNCGS